MKIVKTDMPASWKVSCPADADWRQKRLGGLALTAESCRLWISCGLRPSFETRRPITPKFVRPPELEQPVSGRLAGPRLTSFMDFRECMRRSWVRRHEAPGRFSDLNLRVLHFRDG